VAPDTAVVPPAPSAIDLHTHTTRSDGVMEPADLVQAAWEAGVRLLSLTDHDTLAGYREIVTAGLVPPGLTLIPGVEINALVTRDLGLWEGELHILGFGMHPADDAFDAQVAILTPGDDDALGRPTIARALIAAGSATSVEDAFARLIGHGMPGYVARAGLGPSEAINAIRAAGGVAVLAHFREAPQRPDVIGELIQAGLSGLEVYYRSFDVAAVEGVGLVARDAGLLATGGTDYHGDLGPYAESHAQLWVPPAVGEALLARLGTR